MKINENELLSLEKIVLVPFCLTNCLTPKNHGFYSCVNKCYKCDVSSIREISKNYGFETILVGSSTIQGLKNLIGKKKFERVLGFTCYEGFEKDIIRGVGKENIDNLAFRYDIYAIPRSCAGEGENAIVYKIFKPEIDYNLLIEKLENLKK